MQESKFKRWHVQLVRARSITASCAVRARVGVLEDDAGVGRRTSLRILAMGTLGNGLYRWLNRNEDALSVYEAELSMLADGARLSMAHTKMV